MSDSELQELIEHAAQFCFDQAVVAQQEHMQRTRDFYAECIKDYEGSKDLIKVLKRICRKDVCAVANTWAATNQSQIAEFDEVRFGLARSTAEAIAEVDPDFNTEAYIVGLKDEIDFLAMERAHVQARNSNMLTAANKVALDCEKRPHDPAVLAEVAETKSQLRAFMVLA